MVAGAELFRAHFAGHDHQYVLIGGAACELLMGDAGLEFRATKDLDIVLIVEALDPAFSERFWGFVEAGGYEVRERSEGKRILYRFQKPATQGYPAMLELFSRNTSKWLPSVRYLVVETHDRFRPGSTAAVQGALAGQGFEQRRSGENLVFIRAAPPSAAGASQPSLSVAR